jgi:predicted unusual protein kinase regulating ubiquinone biosynthesis (AarF/ABC1/UbiB family)
MNQSIPQGFAVSPFEGLTVALRVIDAFLKSIEQAVWDLRRTAEEISDATCRDFRTAKAEVADAAIKLARVSQTGARLSVVAASYRFHVTQSAFLPRSMARRGLDRLHQKNARRLRAIAEEHGGAFLKVGQLLSARPDILPKSFVDELAVLQDAAPRVPFGTVRTALERAIGGSLETWFSSFDEEPIAAASMGQVHRATTRDGVEVAVKVLRPGIRTLVEQDLVLLGFFVDALSPMFPPTDHATIVAEIRASVVRELDFEQEARAGSEIGDLLANHPKLLVPEVLPALSTREVLTTRFIRGRKITDVLDELEGSITAGDPGAAARRDAVLGTLIEVFVTQILEFGHFHSDPHPGNVLVTEEGQVVLLDFGSTQRLSREARREYLALVFAFTMNDVEGAVRALSALGFRTRSGRPDTLLRFAEVLIGSFASSAREARFPTPEELEAKARELFAAASDDPVEALPPEFVMIGRVIGTLAGLFTHYRPSIDIARHVLPAVARGMAN